MRVSSGTVRPSTRSQRSSAALQPKSAKGCLAVVKPVWPELCTSSKPVKATSPGICKFLRAKASRAPMAMSSLAHTSTSKSGSAPGTSRDTASIPHAVENSPSRMRSGRTARSCSFKKATSRSRRSRASRLVNGPPAYANRRCPWPSRCSSRRRKPRWLSTRMVGHPSSGSPSETTGPGPVNSRSCFSRSGPRVVSSVEVITRKPSKRRVEIDFPNSARTQSHRSRDPPRPETRVTRFTSCARQKRCTPDQMLSW